MATTSVATGPADAGPDLRRWLTLAVVIMAGFIQILDTSILNVAIPTVMRELGASLRSLQWVVTGYSLTFASLLIVGGRLGDLFGHRRTFILGALLFGTGSLVAALSPNVGVLIVGEALIEGVGAALMLPATLAILSDTFTGRERATAFAAWGATAGAASAFGPLVGGFLTTNYSWRWSFGINVVVAPLAVVGALLFVPATRRVGKVRVPLDAAGAGLAAAGLFFLVFGLTQGSFYGWLAPARDVSIAGRVVWPVTAPVAATPVVFALALLLLLAFARVEQRKERDGASPLFEFGQMRHPTFRYGLLTLVILAIGQLGLVFTLPLFLQNARHLSAQRNGLWMLPMGISIIAGAQVGARLTRRVGVTTVVRLGLCLEAVGVSVIALSVSPRLSFLGLLPGLVLFGTGIGFASSQTTNVILSEVDSRSSGVASGAVTTSRQVGGGLGVAVFGSLLAAQASRLSVAAVDATRTVSEPARQAAAAGVRALGTAYVPEGAALGAAVARGLTDAMRITMLGAAGVLLVGAAVSFLIPPVGPTAAELPVLVTDMSGGRTARLREWVRAAWAGSGG